MPEPAINIADVRTKRNAKIRSSMFYGCFTHMPLRAVCRENLTGK